MKQLIAPLILILAVGVVTSCDRNTEQEPEFEPEFSEELVMTENRQKMDAPLRTELRRIDASEEDEIIRFMFELNLDPTDELREKIAETGVHIQSERNRILSGRGGPDAVRKLSLMEEVRRIEMAQRMSPLDEE
jgi:hypothetical protein